jgi:hypothetical protein
MPRDTRRRALVGTLFENNEEKYIEVRKKFQLTSNQMQRPKHGTKGHQ